MEAREEEAQKEITRGVSLLIGEPKKALLKLSGPMIVAMLILAAYNLVNAVWVAGLGSDALAAVGFVTPIFMVVVGLSNGLGAGVSSSISRRIGAQDKRGADNTTCLLYTSDAADDLLCVDLGGRRIIKKKNTKVA